MPLFRKYVPLPPLPAFDPRRMLVPLSPRDPWTIADSFEGTQIFGATGSGKTSGSGATIARAMLREGFGGLVLTAKRDERDLWVKYCQQTGRSESLLIFSAGGPWRFNFLDYELKRSGPGGGLTENLVNLFVTVLDSGERSSGGGGGSQDPYWERALRQLLRNAIDLLRLAGVGITLPDLAAVIASAPQHPDDVRDSSWQQRSRCFLCLQSAQQRPLTPRDRGDLAVTMEYWLGEFPAMAERTRSNIVSTFTTLADGFLRGHLRELFCGDTNVVPEVTHHGAIILIDLPLKEFHDLGKYAQVLWKYLWQRATESRDTSRNPRPVFLWADEAQNFVTSRDKDFQATARSQRAATVYLTQNISGYFAAIGGKDARSATDALLGNLQTKIFHANGDPETNEYAERVIGKSWRWKHSTSSTNKPDEKQGQPSSSTTASANQSLDAEVLASAFTTLRKGGPASSYHVEGIVFQGGRVWNGTGKTHIRVFFPQQ